MKLCLITRVTILLLLFFIVVLHGKGINSPEVGTPDLQAQDKEPLNAPLDFVSPELKRPIFSLVDKPESDKVFRYGVTGYIKNESFFDSRQDVGPVQEQYFLRPRQPRPDQCGRDINQKGHFNMLAIESRIRCEVAGPQIFRANTFGVLEVDAWSEGVNLTIGRVRLRHAFMYFEWQERSLLMGQYWHPVYNTTCFPDTIGFNGGSPFELFSREAQIRLTKKYGMMTLLLAACSRGTSVIDGPEAVAQEVQNAQIRNAVMPNVDAQVHVQINDHLFGLALDATRMVPRLATQDDKIRVSESLMSYIVFGFASLNWPTFTLNLKAIYAQNGYGYSLISGYAIHCRDKYSGEQTYTNTQCLNAWADMYYKHPVVQPGLYVGYTKNIGACQSVLLIDGERTIFSADQEDIDYIFRFSPRIRWLKQPFILGVELDLTQAAYGNVTNTGRVTNAVPVQNFRAMLATYYVF